MSKARDIASAPIAPSTVSATELGYVDGVTSAIQTQLDAKTAKSTLTTTGDIYYASGANTPARLGIGSTGNVLTVASGIPSWSAPAGGGKVLQVVQATTSTTTSSTSTTFVNSNVTASITPSLSTSKVLVLIALTECYKGADVNNGLQLRLTRGGSSVFVFATQNGRNNVSGGNSFNVASHYLDSPATTSSTTYTVQLASNNTTQVGVADNGVSTIILMEIGA
jgi:hypothetical protein